MQPLVSPIRLHQKRRLTSAIMQPSQDEEEPPLNLPKIKEDFLVGSTGGSAGGFSFWKTKNLMSKLKRPEVAKRRKKSGLSQKSDPVQDETVVEEENKTLGTALEARREALTRPGFF